MDTRYYIELSFKMPDGPETIARFFAGESRSEAAAIFHKLNGNKNIDEKDMVFFHFVETNNGLPMNLDMISCTMGQLGENCKMITKELFKLCSLLSVNH